jgi:hypothetical protein
MVCIQMLNFYGISNIDLIFSCNIAVMIVIYFEWISYFFTSNVSQNNKMGIISPFFETIEKDTCIEKLKFLWQLIMIPMTLHFLPISIILLVDIIHSWIGYTIDELMSFDYVAIIFRFGASSNRVSIIIVMQWIFYNIFHYQPLMKCNLFML